MRKLISMVGVAAGLIAAGPANAVVVFLSASSPVAEGSNYRYTYEARFSQGEGLTDGSRVVIYDFAGYVAGSITTPYGNSVLTSVANTSNLPVFGNTDDPNIVNLEFEYNGPDLDLSGQTFGGFSALSIYNGIVRDGFSAITLKTDGEQAGTGVFSSGSISVPLAGAVPEPATWGLMALGFGLVGASMRNRRRAMVAA